MTRSTADETPAAAKPPLGYVVGKHVNSAPMFWTGDSSCTRDPKGGFVDDPATALWFARSQDATFALKHFLGGDGLVFTLNG